MANKIMITILGDAASAKTAFAEAGDSAEGFAVKVDGAAGMARGALAGMAKALLPLVAVTGAADFLKNAAEGSEALEKAQTSLGVALRKAGDDSQSVLSQFEDLAQGQTRFGVSTLTATTALAQAVLLTGSAAAAHRAYQEALVISKGDNIDFTAALTATARGQEGITTSLKRYGIELSKGATGTDQYREVMARWAGQAEANTTGMDQLRATVDNLTTDAGGELTPALNKAAGATAAWLASSKPKQIIDDLGTAAHDTGLVLDVTLIPAIKGVVEVVEGTLTILDGLFHGRWSQVWSGMEQVAEGSTKALLALPEKYGKSIGAAFSSLGTSIMSDFSAGITGAENLLDSALNDAFINPLNTVIGWLDSVSIPDGASIKTTFGIPTGVKIDYTHLDIPKIPTLAAGGIVSRPTLALIGERGPEAVVPLGRMGGGAGTIVVQVNAPNYVGDHRDLAAAVKTPQVREAIATAMIVASRGGHIRQGDIRP